jgi:hypothetical protein
MKSKIALITAALMAFSLSPAFASTTVHGRVVRYFSTLGANNGGALSNKPGTGGITVSLHNAGIYTHGSVQQIQPLGLLSGGQLYLLFVPNNFKDAGKLAGEVNKDVSLTGRVVAKDGADVFVVSGIK